MTPREELIKKWAVLEYGVKTRVYNDFSQQSIAYIFESPKYSNSDRVKEILESIRHHSREVLEEITEMYNQVSA